MARWAGARAQSRPKSTLEGGQSLFRRLGGVGGARRRHLGGGEKGAEARSRCCAARSQTVGCTRVLIQDADEGQHLFSLTKMQVMMAKICAVGSADLHIYILLSLYVY